MMKGHHQLSGVERRQIHIRNRAKFCFVDGRLAAINPARLLIMLDQELSST
jgi:hypothetical protein